MRGRGILLALVCLTACAACGGPTEPPPDPFALKIANEQTGYDLATGDELPPLDDGRLTLAAPKGWKFVPRPSNSLIKFDKGGTLGIPSIDVTVEPSPYSEFENLTKENVVAFAKLRDKEMLENGRPLLEPAKPMIIGGRPCVRYVIAVRVTSRMGSLDAERQVLETIHDERLYSVNLLILEGEILESRDAAYAVAASMKFHEVEDGGGSVFAAGSDGSEEPKEPEKPASGGRKGPRRGGRKKGDKATEKKQNENNTEKAS